MLYKVNHNFYIIQYLKKGFLNKFRRDAIYRVFVSHPMKRDEMNRDAIIQDAILPDVYLSMN